MAFLIPFIPAIIGAGAGMLAGKHKGKGKGGGGLQQQFMDIMNAEEKKKMGLIDENEGFLNFFSGDPTKSPLYSAYKTSDTEGTAAAYDTAVSNAKMRANERGFGYASPIGQGAETELRGREAADIGRIPGRALLQTIEPSMNAARIKAGESASLNPAAWGGNLTELEKSRQARSSALWASIMQLGGSLGGAAIDKWGGGSGDGADTGGV